LPPEFEQEDPPHWLIDLKGAMPPDAHRFSIRVSLHKTTRAGHAEILILPTNESQDPRSATISLERTECDRLFVILGFSFPGDIASVEDEKAPPIPVSISVHRREPYATISAECNLADWTDTRKPGPPIIEIGKILLMIRLRCDV
jgi:hypothetical protein